MTLGCFSVCFSSATREEDKDGAQQSGPRTAALDTATTFSRGGGSASPTKDMRPSGSAVQRGGGTAPAAPMRAPPPLPPAASSSQRGATPPGSPMAPAQPPAASSLSALAHARRSADPVPSMQAAGEGPARDSVSSSSGAIPPSTSAPLPAHQLQPTPSAQLNTQANLAQVISLIQDLQALSQTGSERSPPCVPKFMALLCTRLGVTWACLSAVSASGQHYQHAGAAHVHNHRHLLRMSPQFVRLIQEAPPPRSPPASYFAPPPGATSFGSGGVGLPSEYAGSDVWPISSAPSVESMRRNHTTGPLTCTLADDTSNLQQLHGDWQALMVRRAMRSVFALPVWSSGNAFQGALTLAMSEPVVWEEQWWLCGVQLLAGWASGLLTQHQHYACMEFFEQVAEAREMEAMAAAFVHTLPEALHWSYLGDVEARLALVSSRLSRALVFAGEGNTLNINHNRGNGVAAAWLGLYGGDSNDLPAVASTGRASGKHSSNSSSMSSSKSSSRSNSKAGGSGAEGSKGSGRAHNGMQNGSGAGGAAASMSIAAVAEDLQMDGRNHSTGHMRGPPQPSPGSQGRAGSPSHGSSNSSASSSSATKVRHTRTSGVITNMQHPLDGTPPELLQIGDPGEQHSSCNSLNDRGGQDTASASTPRAPVASVSISTDGTLLMNALEAGDVMTVKDCSMYNARNRIMPHDLTLEGKTKPFGTLLLLPLVHRGRPLGCVYIFVRSSRLLPMRYWQELAEQTSHAVFARLSGDLRPEWHALLADRAMQAPQEIEHVRSSAPAIAPNFFLLAPAPSFTPAALQPSVPTLPPPSPVPPRPASGSATVDSVSVHDGPSRLPLASTPGASNSAAEASSSSPPRTPGASSSGAPASSRSSSLQLVSVGPPPVSRRAQSSAMPKLTRRSSNAAGGSSGALSPMASRAKPLRSAASVTLVAEAAADAAAAAAAAAAAGAAGTQSGAAATREQRPNSLRGNSASAAVLSVDGGSATSFALSSEAALAVVPEAEGSPPTSSTPTFLSAFSTPSSAFKAAILGLGSPGTASITSPRPSDFGAPGSSNKYETSARQPHHGQNGNALGASGAAATGTTGAADAQTGAPGAKAEPRPSSERDHVAEQQETEEQEGQAKRQLPRRQSSVSASGLRFQVGSGASPPGSEGGSVSGEADPEGSRHVRQLANAPGSGSAHCTIRSTPIPHHPAINRVIKVTKLYEPYVNRKDRKKLKEQQMREQRDKTFVVSLSAASSPPTPPPPTASTSSPSRESRSASAPDADAAPARPRKFLKSISVGRGAAAAGAAAKAEVDLCDGAGSQGGSHQPLPEVPEEASDAGLLPMDLQCWPDLVEVSGRIQSSRLTAVYSGSFQGEPVALKVLSYGSGLDRHALPAQRHCELLMRLTALLPHPHLVRMLMVYPLAYEVVNSAGVKGGTAMTRAAADSAAAAGALSLSGVQPKHGKYRRCLALLSELVPSISLAEALSARLLQHDPHVIPAPGSGSDWQLLLGRSSSSAFLGGGAVRVRSSASGMAAGGVFPQRSSNARRSSVTCLAGVSALPRRSSVSLGLPTPRSSGNLRTSANPYYSMPAPSSLPQHPAGKAPRINEDGPYGLPGVMYGGGSMGGGKPPVSSSASFARRRSSTHTSLVRVSLRGRSPSGGGMPPVEDRERQGSASGAVPFASASTSLPQTRIVPSSFEASTASGAWDRTSPLPARTSRPSASGFHHTSFRQKQQQQPEPGGSRSPFILSASHAAGPGSGESSRHSSQRLLVSLMGQPKGGLPNLPAAAVASGAAGGAGMAALASHMSAPNMQLLCSILLQVAQALQALHQAGLMHGELRPENILLVLPSTTAGQQPPLEVQGGQWAGPAAEATKHLLPLPWHSGASNAQPAVAPGSPSRAPLQHSKLSLYQQQLAPCIGPHGGLQAGIQVKLKDAGLCSLQATPQGPQVRKLVGRPRPSLLPYLPPEVLQGQKPRRSADIYAFGHLMWELYVGPATSSQPGNLYTDERASSSASSSGSAPDSGVPSAPPAAAAAQPRSSKAGWPGASAAFSAFAAGSSSSVPWWYRKLAQQCCNANPKARPSIGKLLAALRAEDHLLVHHPSMDLMSANAASFNYSTAAVFRRDGASTGDASSEYL